MPTTTQQGDFDALANVFKTDNIEDVKKILQNFDIAATDKYEENCLMYCCSNSKSPEVMKVVLEKIEEAGGMELLNNQLTATNEFGWNCLMKAVKSSSSPVMTLVFQKLVEIGDKSLLKSQLSATNNDGWNALIFSCISSPSSKVTKLVFDRIIEAGGQDLLYSQLTATDKYGGTCLILCCRYSSSPEVKTLVFEIIFSLGNGRCILKEQLNANPILRACLECVLTRSFDSPEEKKFLFLVVSAYSITGLFEQHYSQLDKEKRLILRNVCKIESGEWSRATSNDSEMGDVIGEIKQSIKNQKY